MAARRPDEYRELYKDLNQVSERLILQMVEFSEVMVIHRMYLKLEELDLGHLDGAEKVKRLYVFADVVEMGEGEGEGTAPIARLPGSVFVSIICRVLWLPDANESFIALPHIKLHVIESERRFNLNVYNASISTAADTADFAVCIHAGELKFANLEATGPRIMFSILSPGRSASLSNTLDGKNILFSSEVQTITNHPVRHFPVYTRATQFTFQAPRLYSISPASRATVGCTVDYGISQMSLLSGQTLGPAFWVLRGIPDILFMDDEILLAINTSLLIAELAELAHPSVDTRAAVAEHVEWLGTILIEASSKTEETAFHKEYLALSFRAQYLLKTARSTRSLVVPQLQYDVYSPLINRMVQLAQVYDNALTQFKLFIAQNQILGSYLLEQNRAFATRERDMEAFYSELISQKKSELDSTLLKMDQLGAQMDIQTADMKQAEADMNAGLRRFRDRTVARAMFAVIGAIGAIGLAFLTGGATAPAAMSSARTAVTAAQQAARALERVLDILEGLQQVMEVVSIIKELVESLQDVGKLVEAPDMPEMPTEADWAIFVNEIEGVAEGMPEEVTEVSAWKTKCKNVAVLGREMTTTAAYISRLQYDITEHMMLQEISGRQAERLLAIRAADLSSYTEMVMQMDMRTTRIMLDLAKVTFIQNAALMYQCLWPPTLVTTWPSLSMETIWRMLMQHEQAAIHGLIRLGPSFDFMCTHVVRDIPVRLLLDGEDWEFEIPVHDYTIFPATWSRVRIHHLEMKFLQHASVHQPITDTARVYILLQGSRTFHDRNRGHSSILYEAAMPLDYHYAYHLHTGETTLSNMPSHDFITTFMRMTPFTNWRLRLSASAEENHGLDFPTAKRTTDHQNDAATTDIAITFYVSAIRQISF